MPTSCPACSTSTAPGRPALREGGRYGLGTAHLLPGKVAPLERELRAEQEQSTAAAPVLLDGSIGLVSRMDAMQGQQMAKELDRHRDERLLRVQTALERIAQDAYGRCRQPISEERLEAFPEVVLCIQCAGRPAR